MVEHSLQILTSQEKNITTKSHHLFNCPDNLSPSLEIQKFYTLEAFPHSGSGQARLI